MLISEIFYSIQGEGELTGVPSVFIRTAGCNLRCNWCDTMYASWQPKGTEMTIEEILTQVEAFPARYCVITGGEPMVAKEVHFLTRCLHQNDKHITIETAATIPPGDIECDLASLSPKLKNSTPDQRLSETWRQRHEKRRWQPKIIREWINRYPYQLKFVVISASDLEEIQLLLREVGSKIPPAKILLMPEGVTTLAIRGRDEILVERCKRYGYRYCNRLQVEIFGQRRGT